MSPSNIEVRDRCNFDRRRCRRHNKRASASVRRVDPLAVGGVGGGRGSPGQGRRRSFSWLGGLDDLLRVPGLADEAPAVRSSVRQSLARPSLLTTPNWGQDTVGTSDLLRRLACFSYFLRLAAGLPPHPEDGRT